MISRLRTGDEAVVQEICRQFKERVPNEAEAARLLARSDVHVFVAREEGEPAGFAYCYVLLRIDGDTSVFSVESRRRAKDYRKTGSVPPECLSV